MRPPRLFVLIAVVIAALLAPAATAAASCPGADDLPRRLSVAEVRAATLCLINDERRARGLAPLRSNRRLAVAGSRHARDMVSARYFSHDSRSGSAFNTRILRAGYARGRRASVGENLAWGTGALATPRAIVRGWMESPGHRANILQPAFRELGLGVRRGTPRSGFDGATYAAEFGRRW